MADVQTTYSEARAVGFPGDRVDGTPANFLTRTVETALGIPWAAPVSRGSADYGCIIGAAATVVLGVAVRDQSRPAKDGDLYAQKANCRIMQRGTIWVTVGENVTDGATAYWNIATKKWTVTNTDLAVPGAKFDTTTLANGVAVLTIDCRL